MTENVVILIVTSVRKGGQIAQKRLKGIMESIHLMASESNHFNLLLIQFPFLPRIVDEIRHQD